MAAGADRNEPQERCEQAGESSPNRCSDLPPWWVDLRRAQSPVRPSCHVVLPHPRGPVNVNVRKARRLVRAQCHAMLAWHHQCACFACMSTALALGRRTLQPASPLALQLTVCKRRVGPGTTRRATIVYVSPHCMHAQLTVPRATCAGHAPLCCAKHRVVATFEPELRAHHRLRRRA